MEVLLGRISKRYNSTLIPALTDSYDCKLKDGCDIVAPVLIIRSYNMSYNYARFNGRYYYVSSCVFMPSGFLEITLECDVLATYRAEILGTTAFIEYSPTGNNNREIPDTRFQVETKPRYSNVTTPFLNGTYSDIGTYIVAVVSGSPGISVGGFLDYYACNSSDLSSLASFLYTADDNIIDQWNKFVSGASKMIASCFWIPVDISVFGDRNVNIFLAGIDTGITCAYVRTNSLCYNDVIEIPWRWEDFRNSEPWTRVALYVPVLGTFPVSTSNLDGQNAITIRTTLDLTSGAIQVELLTALCRFATYNAQIGAGVPVAVSETSISSAIGGAVAMASSPASGILSMATALTPTVSLSGGGGSRAVNPEDKDIQLMLWTYYSSDEPNSWIPVLGKAQFETMQISSVGNGFVKTRDFSVNIAGYAGEQEKVNNLMDGGVYIE